MNFLRNEHGTGTVIIGDDEPEGEPKTVFLFVKGLKRHVCIRVASEAGLRKRFNLLEQRRSYIDYTWPPPAPKELRLAKTYSMTPDPSTIVNIMVTTVAEAWAIFGGVGAPGVLLMGHNRKDDTFAWSYVESFDILEDGCLITFRPVDVELYKGCVIS